MEGETDFSSDKKTLKFKRDEQRSSTIIRKVLFNLQDVGSIQFISMKLEGAFSSDRIVPLAEIKPQTSTDVDSTLGFQIVANKSAAQKITVSNDYKINGIDIRTKFLDEMVNYTIQLRKDRDNQPAEEVLVFKDLEYIAEPVEGEPPPRDFVWMQIDFDQEVKLSKGTYWIVLKSSSGELVWQLNEMKSVGLDTFQYALGDTGSKWKPLTKNFKKGAHGVFRIRHIPANFSHPPSLRIKLNEHIVLDLKEDLQSVEILMEEYIDIVVLPDNIQSTILSFESQSIGELNISDLLVKFRESGDKRIHLNGFVKSLCFAE